MPKIFKINKILLYFPSLNMITLGNKKKVLIPGCIKYN